MAFEFKKCADGNQTGIIEAAIITNSETVKVGDLVKFVAGFGIRCPIGDGARGVVVGIVTKDGTALDAASTSDYDGTWTPGTKTYTASADNQTDKKVKILMQVHPFAIYSSTPDATIGTTTGSNLPGYYTNVIAATAIPDESSATTAPGQMFILGLDPDDSSKGLYQLAERQGGGLDQTS